MIVYAVQRSGSIKTLFAQSHGHRGSLLLGPLAAVSSAHRMNLAAIHSFRQNTAHGIT